MPMTKSSGVLPPAFSYTDGRPWHQRHRTFLLGLLVVTLGSLVAGAVARLALWRDRDLKASSPSRSRSTSQLGTARFRSDRPDKRKPLSLGQLRSRAMQLERRGDHGGAYLAFSKVLERDSGDPRAMKGFVRNGVELGHDHLLFLLPPDTDLAQLLGVRRWMVKGNWSRAAETYAQLPWRLRRTIQLRLWRAEILQRSGHLERSRQAYARLLDDPRLRERKMRIEAMIGLSEVLLDREYEFASRSMARRARRLLGVDEMGGLRMRIERQLDRCEAAIAPQGRHRP